MLVQCSCHSFIFTFCARKTEYYILRSTTMNCWWSSAPLTLTLYRFRFQQMVLLVACSACSVFCSSPWSSPDLNLRYRLAGGCWHVKFRNCQDHYFIPPTDDLFHRNHLMSKNQWSDHHCCRATDQNWPARRRRHYDVGALHAIRCCFRRFLPRFFAKHPKHSIAPYLLYFCHCTIIFIKWH